MDKRLLDILCCPTTKAPLRLLAEAELASLNRAIAAAEVANQAGARVTAPVAAALITRDGGTIYRIEDDIPVLLADEAIATSQLADFARP
ncbi:MAG TPA: Trm112 family protein [Dokdonella sp.]